MAYWRVAPKEDLAQIAEELITLRKAIDDAMMCLKERADDDEALAKIEKLEAGKVMVFGVNVKAVVQTPRLATCEVSVVHDELRDPIADIAGVKVMAGPPASLGSAERNIR